VVDEIKARAEALGKTLERIGRQLAAKEAPALVVANLLLDLERMGKRLDKHARALADADATPPNLVGGAE
jgi:hypothetical protein